MKIYLKKYFFSALLSFAILFAFGAVLVHAQGTITNPPPTGTITNPPSSNTIKVTIDNPFSKAASDGSVITLFNSILNNIVIPIGGVLCVLAFIYAGFLYVTAGGSDKGIGNAKNMLINATIGTALLLGAGAIAAVITATINQLQGQ